MKPDRISVTEYLEMQGRFGHVDPDQAEAMQESKHRNWERFLRIEEHSMV